MKPSERLDELIERYPVLAREKEHIRQAFCLLLQCYENGGKLMTAGNGGSCADSEHIVGELMKGFVKKRPVPEEFAARLIQTDEKRGMELARKLQQALPAIALTAHSALATAYLNDVDGELAMAQQLYGYGKEGDVLLAISTSGNSRNILYAAAVARAMKIKVIGLTGKDGGELAGMCDAAIVVPEQETYRIQELHLPVYHGLCLMLEDHFFAR
ncbi:MAG TPA: SIS domain-containing protein [Candidatus Cottocaccamicrobium excrementipullorum]|mgnify:CR=1 FL=1|nr:SIS domain-containing protein [Candidatus Cottocaccamicrobium excrementipullorum]